MVLFHTYLPSLCFKDIYIGLKKFPRNVGDLQGMANRDATNNKNVPDLETKDES